MVRQRQRSATRFPTMGQRSADSDPCQTRRRELVPRAWRTTATDTADDLGNDSRTRRTLLGRLALDTIRRRDPIDRARVTREAIFEALVTAQMDAEERPSRERSLAITKLDEAMMWQDRVMWLMENTEPVIPCHDPNCSYAVHNANRAHSYGTIHDHTETHIAAGGADGRDDHAS